MRDGTDGNWAFEPLGSQRAILGESPFVSRDGEHVWWVDTPGRQLFLTHTHDGETRCWPLGEQIGFVAEIGDACILGMQSGLFTFDVATGGLSLVPGTSPGPGMRYNDACVDAYGRLWAGTMDLDGEAANGRLYRFGDTFEKTEVATGFRRVNGLAHDVGHNSLIVSDSHPEICSIWSLDFPASGKLGERRLMTRMVPQQQGRPDGAFIDHDGRYWVASLEGGGLFSPANGEMPEKTRRLPVSLPTKAALGADGRLYITSKSNEVDPLGGLLMIGRQKGVAAA